MRRGSVVLYRFHCAFFRAATMNFTNACLLYTSDAADEEDSVDANSDVF